MKPIVGGYQGHAPDVDLMNGQYPAVPHAPRGRAEERDGIFPMDEHVSCDHAVEGAGAFKGVERGFPEDDVVEARALCRPRA